MLPDVPTPQFPYRILDLVGEGGMGEVYRAEDVQLGRLVAIKLIKRSYIESLSVQDAQDAVRRFLQEARAAASLSHPGITVVHRVGAEGGLPYIAMEWLEGRTLDDVINASGRLAVDVAARLGLAVLSALDAAHRAGIVHRDIKPGNLFVTTDRRVKVTDFGIARVQGSTLAHTQAGAVIGTPQYAAPEQMAGQAVDARADLYALGVVLYEVVTGRPLFEGDSLFEIIGKVQRAAPPRASEAVADVPASFDRFLAVALAKDPRDRFANAADMARALQHFLTPTGTLAQQATQAPSAAVARPEVTTLLADRGDVPSMVAAVARSWPSRALGAQACAPLLGRLLDRPVHTAAFCGALDFAGGLLLVCDGVLLGAVDPASGRVGDAAIDALPPRGEATLYEYPPGGDPRVVALLASLTAPPRVRLSGLDAAVVDVPKLCAKLSSEGFDGVLRATCGGAVAFVLFSRGRRVVDLFGPGWLHDPTQRRWETWIAEAGATVCVEDRQAVFPSASFRHRLRGTALEVVRPPARDEGRIRQDTRAASESLSLRPAAAAGAAESSFQSLVDADPAVAAVRWLLVDVATQFEQHRRSDRWRAMLSSLPAVVSVRLHDDAVVGEGFAVSFDAATFDEQGRMLHALDRVTAGTPDAVAAFIEKARAARHSKGSAGNLTGAVLVAPSFSEAALDAYLNALRSSRGAVSMVMGLLSHREGFLVVGHGGCHVLLVEEVEGRRRPLVPEAG